MYKHTLIVIVLLALSANANAQREYSPDTPSGRVGARIGFLTGSALRVDGRKETTSTGISAGVTIDIPAHQYVSLGISFDLHNLIAFGQHGKFFNGYFELKFNKLLDNRDMRLRPVLGTGIGVLPLFQRTYFREVSPGVDQLVTDVLSEQTLMLTVKFGLEASFRLSEKASWLTEVAALGLPHDWSRRSHIRYGPAFLIRAGIMI